MKVLIHLERQESIKQASGLYVWAIFLVNKVIQPLCQHTICLVTASHSYKDRMFPPQSPSTATIIPSPVTLNENPPPPFNPLTPSLTSSLQPSVPHQLIHPENPLFSTASHLCTPSLLASSALNPGPNFDTLFLSTTTLTVQKLFHTDGRWGRRAGCPATKVTGARPQFVATMVQEKRCWI